MSERSCRRCGCTDEDCSRCVERTGSPCRWVEDDLCSACFPDYAKIGYHTRRAVLAFVEEHQVPPDGPGGFLWAVLTNDLKTACAQADDDNRHAIWELHAWLYNFAPAGCWGDETSVRAWLIPKGRWDAGERARAVLRLDDWPECCSIPGAEDGSPHCQEIQLKGECARVKQQAGDA